LEGRPYEQCASLRKGSFNRALMNALPALAPADMKLTEAPSFRGFPLYDADLQAKGFPPDVTALAHAIRAADGIIIITPEYNYSIPGALKNAIDWVSRLPDQPFKEKPVAIQSATGGPLGGARMQYHLRQSDDLSQRLLIRNAGNLRRAGTHQVRRKDTGTQGRDHQEVCGPTAGRLHQVHRAREGLTGRVPFCGNVETFAATQTNRPGGSIRRIPSSLGRPETFHVSLTVRTATRRDPARNRRALFQSVHIIRLNDPDVLGFELAGDIGACRPKA
jgi:hypothetical protein